MNKLLQHRPFHIVLAIKDYDVATKTIYVREDIKPVIYKKNISWDSALRQTRWHVFDAKDDVNNVWHKGYVILERYNYDDLHDNYNPNRSNPNDTTDPLIHIEFRNKDGKLVALSLRSTTINGWRTPGIYTVNNVYD